MIRQRNIAHHATCGLQWWSMANIIAGALSRHEGWGIRLPGVEKVDIYGYGGKIGAITDPPNGMHFGVAVDEDIPDYSGTGAVVNDEMGSAYLADAAQRNIFKWLDEPFTVEALPNEAYDIAGGTWTKALSMRIVFYNETDVPGAGGASAASLFGQILYRPWFPADI